MSSLYTVAQRSGVVAATHSGSFHADDVFAAAALRLVNPSLSILRTRDPKLLESADILFDVGRVFDPASCRFDHHQLGYKEVRNNGIPYSSFGLVWRELGAELCGSAASAARIDYWLVQGVDAVDCGVTLIKEAAPVSIMSISTAIGSFNPGWQDDSSAATKDQAFERAMGVAQAILQNAMRGAQGLEAARAGVTQSTLLENGRLLLLNRDLPWQETVMGSARYAEVLFVVYPDSQTKWHVHTVPEFAGSFNNRKSLPAAWAGLDEDKLDAVTGIEGGVFCHRGRFVAGHRTQEGALHMARLALLEPD